MCIQNIDEVVFIGKKVNRVACGSAHTLAWSTSKPMSAGKLPTRVPMEYDHLRDISIPILRNRLVLLHHFSDIFCPSVAMFDLSAPTSAQLTVLTALGAISNDNVVDSAGQAAPMTVGIDRLRSMLVSSAKVRCDCLKSKVC